MKYTYAYKTPDGTRHEASIEAESREAVFAALREQGIRPIKVVAADGSKANGAPVGVRRRVVAVAILVAVVAAVGATAAFLRIVRPAPKVEAFQADQTRRYPIGDAAIIEKGILTGWSDVFEHEGDRFLASFAVPGVKAGQRNTTVEEIEAALGRKIEPTPEDGLEARQIKSMVEGMKAEARAYIAAGGSVVEYGKRLTERQDAEIAIYERTKADLEQAKETMRGNALINYWELQNDKLRNLGIRPLTLESLE
jgi:plasmid stability protein